MLGALPLSVLIQEDTENRELLFFWVTCATGGSWFAREK